MPNLVKGELREAKKTYPGRFDKLMQDIKYKETNGIIIGPEFSRIFAEHILQAIDIALLRELSKSKIKFEEDYSIFRYVDDYFVFYNTTECKEKIVVTLQHELKQYNFYLNTEKELIYENPIVTEISMGKSKIRHLLDDVLKYKEEKIIQPDTKDIVIKYKLNAWSIKQLVLEYKIVLKSCQVYYRDVLNYTLALVERKIKKIFKKHCEIEQENRSEKQLANALNEIINFIYFIYSVNPKVNSSIRLCRILILIIKYYKKGFKGTSFKEKIYKNIFDNTTLVLNTNNMTDHAQVETLYLFTLLAELGREYRLSEKMIIKYFNIQDPDNEKKLETKQLNYFSITALLFYIRDANQYAKVRDALHIGVLEKIKKSNHDASAAETIFLIRDIISCPYIESTKKEAILTELSVEDPSDRNMIIEYCMSNRSVSFTTWRNFELQKELDGKQGQEVY